MPEYLFDFYSFDFFKSSDVADVSTAAAVGTGADLLTSSDTPNAIGLEAGGAAPDLVEANVASTDPTSSATADPGTDLVESSGAADDSASTAGAIAELVERVLCMNSMHGDLSDGADSGAAIAVEDFSLFGDAATVEDFSLFEVNIFF